MDEESVETAEGKPTVLVVDDEEALAIGIARGLKRMGYDAVVATTGGEALQLLEDRLFDVMLTDLHMPQLRGDELQRLARQKDPDLAVLLITASHDVSCAVECLKEGVYDYMNKPCNLSDVVARVNKALEKRRLVLDKKRLEQENQNYQLNLEKRVAQQAERIRKMLQGSLETLIQALETKDEYIRNHSTRVADLASVLAMRLRPDDPNWSARLRVAALFHDIGKIGIPEAILNKPGRLEEDEMAQIRRYPEIGEAILRPLLGNDTEMLAIVRNHHELWNGEGYPDGLIGEATPQGARIVAVADAYDAMTSVRSYRPGMPSARALQILSEGAGTHWDPQVVETFLSMVDEGTLSHLLDVTSTAAMQEIPIPCVDDSEIPPPWLTNAANKPVQRGVSSATTDVYASAAPSKTSNAWSRRPIVPASGNMDEEGIERLRTNIGAMMARGDHDFILNLSQVGLLNPEAIQLIHLLHLRALEVGGRMAVCDAPEHAMEAFRNAQLEGVLLFEQSPIRHPRRSSRYAQEQRIPLRDLYTRT